MARFTTLAFLLLNVAAAQTQAQELIAIHAPTHQTDTVHLDGVSVIGQEAMQRSKWFCDGNAQIVHSTLDWQPPAQATTLQPLLSRVAGVQTTPYSGAPGAWATVRIRGAANVSGNEQPLYVVDGVPVYNTDVTPERWPAPTASPFPFVPTPTPGTPNANPLLDLPMEEIEQIEVVYGAGATARYGMQGGNGVVLITTRQGGRGRATPQAPRVRYAGWAGLQQVRQRYEVLDARQYAALANEAADLQRRPLPYPAATLANLREVDWQDRRLRGAGVTGHNVSLDGVTAHHTRYYVAADYLRQAGVVAQSGLTRYQLRTNLAQQITSKLSVGLNASASQLDQYYAGTALDAGPALRETLLAVPVVGAGPPRPLQEFDADSRTPRTRRLVVQLSATYQFSPALSLRLRGSREQATARALGTHTQQANGGPPESSVATANSQSWVADAALNYQRTFGITHVVTAALTYQRQEFERDWGIETRTPSTYATAHYTESSRPLHSPAAALSYTYAGRYEAQTWLRYDFIRPPGNSLPTNQYRFLSPGGQLSWHLHKEAFLAAATSLSALTLWAGAGKTGSSLASGAFFSLAPPARTVQHDAGLRVGVLNNHLTLDVAAYQRRTRHAQARVLIPVPSTVGPSVLTELPNVKLLNQGLTFTLSSTWQWRRLVATSQVAAATNRNEVEGLGLPAAGGFTAFPGLHVGQSLGRPYVLEQDGTYPAGSPQAGQRRYVDRNGDGRLDNADGYYTSSNLPRYTISYFQQLHLRRFQLDAQFDGLFGYSLFNATLLALDTPNSARNGSPRTLDRWTLTHQHTAVPQVDSSPSGALSDQDLASGDHVRLSQLTLNYEILNRANGKVSVWVGGQNLFVTGSYRGYDPNVSGGGAAPLLAGQDASVYPVARVWQVGVRGQF